MEHMGSLSSRHTQVGVLNADLCLCLLFQVQPGVCPLPGTAAGALGQYRLRLRHVSALCRARTLTQDQLLAQPFLLSSLHAWWLWRLERALLMFLWLSPSFSSVSCSHTSFLPPDISSGSLCIS